MSKAITKASTKQKSKSFKIPSDFFQNKKIINTIFSFLPKKTIVRLISTSSKLQKEYDIKIDDYFVARKYQEKIKNYNNNYEDLFYQVLCIPQKLPYNRFIIFNCFLDKRNQIIK